MSRTGLAAVPAIPAALTHLTSLVDGRPTDHTLRRQDGGLP
ncbi:hypothetical protein ACWEGX_18555 [Streptomyces chartreusis]